jgi:hypothetical protein
MKIDNDFRKDGKMTPEAIALNNEAEKITNELFEKYGDTMSLESIAYIISTAATTAVLDVVTRW